MNTKRLTYIALTLLGLSLISFTLIKVGIINITFGGTIINGANTRDNGNTPTSNQGNNPAQLIGQTTGTFEGCAYSEVHHSPDGTTWSPDVGNQPTSLQIWSNRTSNQTLYKVWLPNGFHTGDGRRLEFPSGGGEYDSFATGCDTAAQDWFNRDGTEHTASIDDLINQYNLAVAV